MVPSYYELSDIGLRFCFKESFETKKVYKNGVKNVRKRIGKGLGDELAGLRKTFGRWADYNQGVLLEDCFEDLGNRDVGDLDSNLIKLNMYTGKRFGRKLEELRKYFSKAAVSNHLKEEFKERLGEYIRKIEDLDASDCFEVSVDFNGNSGKIYDSPSKVLASIVEQDYLILVDKALDVLSGDESCREKLFNYQLKTLENKFSEGLLDGSKEMVVSTMALLNIFTMEPEIVVSKFGMVWIGLGV